VAAESNADYVRLVFDRAFSAGDLSVLDDRIAEDVVNHSTSQDDPLRGREEMKAFIRAVRGGFPDLHTRIEDLVDAGDTVVVRITVTGTHRAPYRGIPPTGRRFRAGEIIIIRFDDEGRLAESWQEFDALALLTQLGVVPGEGVGPLGLIRWTFGTIARFALLEARHRRASRRSKAGG
jgi:steroid delta-isomerase-like uncharacterized protein